MKDRLSRVERFLALHVPGRPLLLPNPWDVGIARQLAALGFEALASTSSGFAGTLGRQDGCVRRDEALAHAAQLAAATDLPLSGDLENGFGHGADEVARTVALAAEAGLAGCSIEDYSGDPAQPIYDLEQARARVAAACEVARGASTRIVLTARAENHLHGVDDFDDTLARLCAYAEAGADCVYAPGLVDPARIERLVRAVDVPVNVLLRPGGPTVAELARAGVARISIGGALYQATLTLVARLGRALLAGRTEDLLAEGKAGNELLSVFDAP